ncbi:MAG: fatty acid desaturase [Betaproteobacteria bacterium]
MLYGVFDLPVWGWVLVALGITHVTIAAVTIYLHRHQAHRAIELSPLPSHFFRFWLWLTTGMVTREWAAIHRKHHARCETPDDPHSPQQKGIWTVLFKGALLYRRESQNRVTVERFGHGTPDDWIERKLYSPFSFIGIFVMLTINLVLFGLVPGLLIWATQMIWIPLWAAGVINGVGHFWGYRNFDVTDASTNISPWGILIGGEELHNNHHAFATSAKFSNKWYEFDLGWMYIRMLAALGLARVKHVAPRPRVGALRPEIDAATLQAVIAYRHDLLARYARSLKPIYKQELARLQDRGRFAGLRRWLAVDAQRLPGEWRARLDDLLAQSQVLATLYRMRDELAAVWNRTNASREQLIEELRDWCRRAESSGIKPLQELSFRMRSYVPT